MALDHIPSTYHYPTEQVDPATPEPTLTPLQNHEKLCAFRYGTIMVQISRLEKAVYGTAALVVTLFITKLFGIL